MNQERVTITTGELPLSAWRAIYDGADVHLDPACRAAVDAAARTIDRIVADGEPVYGINTGFGKLASVRIDSADLATLQRNIVLSHCAGVGDRLPAAVTRLMMALKIASLAHGASGVRWSTIDHLARCLSAGLIPVVPAQGSVGASGDLAPLAHMTAALMGVGSFIVNGREVGADAALASAGLAPLEPGPKEGLALLNGTQVSTALALAGLFAAERVFQAALVTGALSTDAARGSDGPFDPRIHAARRQPGQIDAAARLRALMAGSAIRASHLTGDDRVQDPYCLRCQPQVMGACLDLMGFAAGVFLREANAVSDNPLVFARENEILSGGNFHAQPVAMAADTLALSIAEIGSLSERRIALLVDANLSTLPAFLVAEPGLNSGFMIAQVTAAALAAENKALAHPRSVDSLPTSANQEDHVSMATGAALRLFAMARNTAAIVAIELLAAAQGIDLRAPLATSAPLQEAHAIVRRRAAFWDRDRAFAPDLARMREAVEAGAFEHLAMLPPA